MGIGAGGGGWGRVKADVWRTRQKHDCRRGMRTYPRVSLAQERGAGFSTKVRVRRRERAIEMDSERGRVARARAVDERNTR